MSGGQKPSQKQLSKFSKVVDFQQKNRPSQNPEFSASRYILSYTYLGYIRGGADRDHFMVESGPIYARRRSLYGRIDTIFEAFYRIRTSV